jgi:putative nucleotidyltransferase with HDIG domain
VTFAGLAYAAANNAFILVVWYLDEGIRPAAAFSERLAWKLPYDAACGVLAGLLVVSEREMGLGALALFAVPLLLIWIGEKNQIDHSRRIVNELRYTNHELESANTRLRDLLADNRRLLDETHRSYLSTITSLARTIEAKDPYTGGHTERVAHVALALAIELGFEEDALRAVQVGAIIHDIGKIGIPDAILLKPGKLSDEEFAEMRRHPEISSYILDELELPEIVKQMARHHHERFDGRGYPDGLSGEEIPLAARILTVADAFDAMTSDRPYRAALAEDVAREEIEKGSGTQFCPRVAAALARVLDSGVVSPPAPEPASPAVLQVPSPATPA